MKKEIKIGKFTVGEGHRPFVIAEMSGNHNQSIERAFAIVDAAAAAGAHALKLQTYTADTMTLNVKSEGFTIEDNNSLWKGRSLYDLYQEAHTPWDWHKKIFDRCKEHGMVAFSSPFDDSAVDFLESLDVPAFKVASFENTYIPMIKKIARLGKPMIISTGMATVGELEYTVKIAKENGCEDIILLKCTSTYPATPADTNIRTIPHMRELFDVQVGLSDHTMGCGAAIAAVAMGATVVEKHFTLARADGGVDSTFSLEPAELKILVDETERAWQALGGVRYGTTSAQEKKSLQFRRSIYVAKPVQQGEAFTAENIRCVRPGLGLETRYYEDLIGKKANRNIAPGTPMSLEYVTSQ